MRASSAKAKGRRLQDYVKGQILHWFPTLHEDDVKCAIMGESGQDIHLSPAAQKLFPFAVEAKNQERMNIWDALKQAEAHARPGLDPLVVFKRNRSEVYVALKLDDFLEHVSTR